MRRALAVLLLVSGCGPGKSTPPPPTQPTVQITTGTQSVLATQLKVNTNVEGCDSVATLTLADHGHVLSTLTNAPASAEFTLTEQGLQPLYASDGIAADLALVATATCADGQSATSMAAGVEFMPADVLYPGTFGGTSFSIEPDASGLVQCVNGVVTRLDTSGNVLESTGNQLPYACTDEGYLVRGETNELYWVDTTAFSRMTQNLQVLGNFGFVAAALYLPPNANIVVGVGPIAQSSQMFWADRTNGGTSTTLCLSGSVDGVPVSGTRGLVVPEESMDSTNNALVDLEIEVWSFSTQGAITTSPTVLATLGAGAVDTAPIPLMSLSSDGATAYFVGGSSQNQVYACAIDLLCVAPSEGGGQVFLVTIPGGPYTAAIPLGSNLIAIGPSEAQFLDRSTGKTVGAPIAPTGGLHMLTVYPGPGASSYILDGDDAGNVLEVIILDSPGHEAARYNVPSSGFGFDLDADLRAYVLQGTLASLLLPVDYAAAR